MDFYCRAFTSIGPFRASVDRFGVDYWPADCKVRRFGRSSQNLSQTSAVLEYVLAKQ